MEKIVGILIAIGLVIAFIVYVVLPILGILLGIGVAILGCIAIAGLISGVFVGINNFFIVLKEAHDSLP